MKLPMGVLLASTVMIHGASAQQREWRECLSDEQTRTLTCIDYYADRDGQKRKLRGPYMERVPKGQIPPMFFDPPGSGGPCKAGVNCE